MSSVHVAGASRASDFVDRRSTESGRLKVAAKPWPPNQRSKAADTKRRRQWTHPPGRLNVSTLVFTMRQSTTTVVILNVGRAALPRAAVERHKGHTRVC
jgi:hypothetical protein